MTRRGRPTGYRKTNPRTVHKAQWYTPDEAERIEQAARHLRVSLAKFIRSAAVRAASEVSDA